MEKVISDFILMISGIRHDSDVAWDCCLLESTKFWIDFWERGLLETQVSDEAGEYYSWNEGTNNTVLEVEAEVTNNHQFHNSSDL